MSKKLAYGQIGHLLLNTITGFHTFRVYSEDKKSFDDYDVCAEDIKIKIVDNYVALEKTDDGNYLTWADHALGKNKKTYRGEIVEIKESEAICWVEIAKDLRVKTSFPVEQFDFPHVGLQFVWTKERIKALWSPEQKKAVLDELDKLNAEWDELSKENPKFFEEN